MICWKCGYQNPESNKFCGSCGTELQIKNAVNVQNTVSEDSVMVCWKCGNLNPESNQFCSMCGANLRKADTIVREPSEKESHLVKEDIHPQIDSERKQQNAHEESSGINMQGETGLLKILSLIFAVLYLFKSFTTIFVILEAVENIFDGWHIFLSIGSFLISILLLLSSSAFAFMLVLFGMRRTEKNEEMLYLGVVSAAGLRVIIATLNMIWSAIFTAVTYYKKFPVMDFIMPWIKTLLFVAFVTGVLYVLFVMVGRRPFLGKSKDELKQMLKEFPEFLQKETEQFSSGFVDGKGTQKNASGVVIPNQLKTNRGLLKYVVISILTCGIYPFIFYYEIARDVNIICEEDGEHTAGLLKLIVFSILTCGIYWYIWEYQFVDRIANNAPRYGVKMTETGTTVLLWSIFGSWCCGIGFFIALYIMIHSLNRLAKAYNERNVAKIAEDITGNL